MQMETKDRSSNQLPCFILLVYSYDCSESIFRIKSEKRRHDPESGEQGLGHLQVNQSRQEPWQKYTTVNRNDIIGAIW